MGTRFWNVPSNMGSLWNTFEFQSDKLKGFKIGGGVTIRDKQTACCDAPTSTIPGYATVELLVAYSNKAGKSKITTQLNVTNLLDQHYYTGLNTLRDSNSGIVDVGQPRAVIGSINIQY